MTEPLTVLGNPQNITSIPLEYRGKGFYSRYFLVLKKTELEANPGAETVECLHSSYEVHDGYAGCHNPIAE